MQASGARVGLASMDVCGGGSVIATTPFNVSNSSLPTRLRTRPDIQFEKVVYRGEPHWVAKEPLQLKYHHLNEQEYVVLKWLAEPLSFDELRYRFERRFSPHRVTLKELQSFVLSLRQKSLVVPEAVGQGHHLLEQRKEEARKELLGKLKNFYAIKWKGFDPERILNTLYPYVGWFFSKQVVIINAVLIAVAIIWGLINFEEIQSRLPAFSEFFAPKNWVRLFLLTSCLKIVHEFGHGLSFKRFGGECHEIGVMILFFTPTLYCDTTDSWMLRNRWQRAAVGLAGIYVELFTFAIATAVWWLSTNDAVQMVALQIIFLCSLSTVLINGNPFIKYDGYYVLSDITEVPNLQKKAGEVVRTWCLRNLLGVKDKDYDWSVVDIRHWLAAYSLGAFAYRIFITISISFFLSQMLGRFGLSSVALAMALMSVAGLTIMPLWSFRKQAMKPGMSLQIKKKSLVTSGIAISVGVAAILLVPLPASMECRFGVTLASNQTIYAMEDGRLEDVYVVEGQTLEPGALIARFENCDLQVESLEAERDYKVTLAEYRSAKVSQRTSAKTVASLEEKLRRKERIHSQQEQRLSYLVIRSPGPGVLLDVPSRPSESGLGEDLQSWEGHVLQPENLGTWVQRGTPLAILGDPQRPTATLVVRQDQIELIQSGMPVTLMMDSDSNRRFHGHLDIISTSDTDPEQMPSSLASEEQAAASARTNPNEQSDLTADNSQPNPNLSQEVQFQATVILDDVTEQALIVGTKGYAKVHIGNRSLGWRLKRWVLNNWNLNF